jgi:hypothetical protein
MQSNRASGEGLAGVETPPGEPSTIEKDREKTTNVSGLWPIL